MLSVGIIKEGKIPPDSRVAMTPTQCRKAQSKFGIRIFIQSAENRCFSNNEYLAAGIEVCEDVSKCDLLLGIKEVPISQLIDGKTYMFFSHTIKEQAYNRDLLRAILVKKITLIDYEVLTDEYNQRLIAFGHFAGMVGAYNGIWAFGQRTNSFNLPRLYKCQDYSEAKSNFKKISIPKVRIVLTGTGRVSTGAIQVLKDMRIHRVSPEDYLVTDYTSPVFTQLSAEDYCEHQDGISFNKNEFYTDPDHFIMKFKRYYQLSDILINGIYYDPKAAPFFTLYEMQGADFRIRTISDISCDLAPQSSIPSSIRNTTITNPVFGFNPQSGKEEDPYQEHVIDMITIDNLPNELPRDASLAFGNQFLNHILPKWMTGDPLNTLDQATIAKNGHLTRSFSYLQDYVDGIK